MPDDSDPMHDQQPNDDQKRPEVQSYPASPPPTAEQQTSFFAGRASIGLDVPGAVQTRLPPDPNERQMDSKLVVVMDIGADIPFCRAQVFNVGNRRRVNAEKTGKSSGKNQDQSASFFDPNNADGKALRDELALETLTELIDWLKAGGRVAIHDATNSTRERRAKLLDRLSQEPEIKVLLLESVCTDKLVLERNMRLKLSGPDYKDKDPAVALKDFKSRVANYERAYEPIGEWEEERDVQFCKIINVGKKVIAYNISGYLSGQAVFYLMNFNLAERQIFLTRHGESTDNIVDRIGGDAPLSALGQKFGTALAKFIDRQRQAFEETRKKDKMEEIKQFEQFEAADEELEGGTSLTKSLSETNHKQCQQTQGRFVIWTSMLQRAVQTVESFNAAEYDIKVNIFDSLTKYILALTISFVVFQLREGMSYYEIQRQYPEEFAARQANKLYYRYPGIGGESYTVYSVAPDVIHRLQSMIIELERMTQSCLIVTHRVVMRILLGYLLDWTHDEMPHMDVPIHTVYELRPKPYGTELKKWQYNPEKDDFFEF
ncbi:hypothetical protein INT43_004588 [Umbelopsis isabellina]|uniref:6-phosphofructo-2-kinase domain-containing protein n=1 Tax=Mortierella isabellina TaxID=91625 RepID=A0A8H7UB63_MORIS|nr:hypothetical protein INT43_004588 [Umbelopsis isabellina]